MQVWARRTSKMSWKPRHRITERVPVSVKIRRVIPRASVGEAGQPASYQRGWTKQDRSGRCDKKLGMLGRHPVARNIVYGEKAGALMVNF